MIRRFYTFIAYLALPLVFGTTLWRGLRDRAYWDRLSERFGFGRQQTTPKPVWVHAVSVGEVQAAVPLVKALLARYPQIPVVLTATTPTGAQLARSLFRDTIQVRYLPYDLPGSVRRFFERVNPRLGLILETEIWPNLYAECGRRGIPLVLVSARLSQKFIGRYRRLVSLFRDALSHDVTIAAQTIGDAERFISIGASKDKTYITGNIKFDVELPATLPHDGLDLRARYAPDRRAFWVAGSTHEGEENIVLDAHVRIRSRFPTAVLVLAPRHRNRFETVAQLLRQRDMSFVTRSSGEPVHAMTEVVLLDTLGELVTFYAAADAAFVGGSLVPVGGHNLLEPAVLGVPVLTGTHNFNNGRVAQLLFDGGAASMVHDAAELAGRVNELIADPGKRAAAGEQGRRTLCESRGALGRLLELIEPLLAR